MSNSDHQRQSGIEAVGEVPWGTHFCQFYQGRQTLVDALVPYFQAGLDAGEYCVWVASEPLDRDDAEAELRRAVPEVDDYLAAGQLEFYAHDQWYPGGAFEPSRILDQWRRKYDQALDRGFTGMRLTGNTFWLQRHGWDDFLEYEREVNASFGGQRIIGLCTYSLDRCCAGDVLDVVQAHQFAVFHDHGTQRMLHSDALSAAHRDLMRANQRLQEMSRQLCTAESRERRRLAHLLHEDLQQVMAAARMQVDVARNRSVPAASPALQRAHEILGEAIELARGIASEISPPLLHTAGFGAALSWLARHFEQRFGLRVALDLGAGVDTRGQDLADFLFSAVRELLFNIVKHAGVQDAQVRVRRSESGALLISVEDHGRGCDPAAVLDATPSSGFGLSSIHERLALQGGHLRVESGDGGGCRVTLISPAS